MKRAALVVLAVATSSCSLLFNPDRVKVAQCDPVALTPFEAIAGEGTSLTWQWPSPAIAVGFTEWELCWSQTEGATGKCLEFPYGSCEGGLCSFTLDGADAGLQYNRRVYGRLTARDRCNTTFTSVTASATPINGTFADTQGIDITSPCDAGVSISAPGELAFVQVAGCVSLAMMGDELWRDGTLELEYRVFGDSLAGVGVRAPVGGNTAPRNGVIVTAAQSFPASAYVTRRETNGSDVAVASAVPVIRDAQWGTMRVSLLGPWISVQLGTTRSDLREVIRWRDPSTQGPASGRLGFALANLLSAARIEVKNLRVRSGASIPDGGPTRDSWSFAGLDALHGVRRVNGASLTACPRFDAGCATCFPDAGSQCLEIAGNAQATVEAPIGLDYQRPWRVKFKFVANPGGFPSSPSLLRTTVVAPAPFWLYEFAGFPLIDSPMTSWSQPLRAFGDSAQSLGPITTGQWNSFEMIFNPAASEYTVNRNGTLARMGGSPAALGAHLGALVLGGGGNFQGYFTDLQISQDP